MDKNNDFELDFDFEKEYGFSMEDIMDSDTDLDLDLDLELDLDLDAELDPDPDSRQEPDPVPELNDAQILKFRKPQQAQPQDTQAPEDPAQQLTEDGTSANEQQPPVEAEPDPAPQMPQQPQTPVAQPFAKQAPRQSGRRDQRPRRQNPLKVAHQPLIPEDEQFRREAAQRPVAPMQERAAQRPRRKKRSQMQIIKEDYLPYGIAGLALLLCLVFIIGSVVRNVSGNSSSRKDAQEAAIREKEEADRLQAEADRIRKEAQNLADSYDYEAAIALINGFGSNLSKFPELQTDLSRYAKTQDTMVEYNSFRDIPNLSFHVLIADPDTAFSSKPYGPKYLQNFITVSEFEKILQQLYENDYVLVNFDSFVEKTVNEDGTVSLTTKPIKLPEGKKPVMITETLVNYFDYMVNGDDDTAGEPDKDGDGFACKLVVQDGKVVAKRIDSTGKEVYGNYDLVPILNSFVDQNPAFSYKGAKAILAVTGSEGIFGYRVNKGDAAEISQCKELVKALKADGYMLACNSYTNISYATIKTTDIKEDLDKWESNIQSVIGSDVDILVYALGSDVGAPSVNEKNGKVSYGSKYDTMMGYGFRYFLGCANKAAVDTTIDSGYVYQKRIMVTGSMLVNSPDSLKPFFEVAKIKDASRTT